MALATGSGYAVATLTNPSAALTDFSLMINLADLPQAWWDQVNTSDGTRGRAAKHSDATEFACDWIDFDDTLETGLLRVKWAGSLASSGTQQLRIYPPRTANATVAASATYGSDNAYASHWNRYLADGGLTDRTSNSNGHTANSSGNPTPGGATGKLGAATTFDASNDWTYGPTYNQDADFTFMAWVKPATDTGVRMVFDGLSGTGATGWVTGTIARVDMRDTIPTTVSCISASGAFNNGSWDQYIYEADVSGNAVLRKNGSTALDTEVISGLGDTSMGETNFNIGQNGASGQLWNGDMQEIQVHTSLLSSAWLNTEYSQINDNATFWGTWAWHMSKQAAYNHYHRNLRHATNR